MTRRRQILSALQEAERVATHKAAEQRSCLKVMGELDSRGLALYRWVLKKGRITARDAVRAEVAQIANTDSARDLLESLAARGLLRQVLSPNPGRGRRTVFYEERTMASTSVRQARSMWAVLVVKWPTFFTLS